MTRTIDPDAAMEPAELAHFVLRVRDLERSVAWYSTVLGMKMVHRSEKLPIAFMSNDDEHHRLALVQAASDEQVPEGSAGLDHVAYTLRGLGDLLATYRRLAAQDILPVWPINHGLTTSLYYADPDGSRVEFQVENFASKAELQAYMRSPEFAENPIGVDFDPERLCERYERGDPLEDLVKLGSTA